MVSDVFARIQIHIFATLICLVMLVETQNHKDSRKYPFRLFRAQLIACMLLLGSEAASWSSVGATKFFWNTVCFALHAFPGYLFSLYADYQLGPVKNSCGVILCRGWFRCCWQKFWLSRTCLFRSCSVLTAMVFIGAKAGFSSTRH